MKGNTQNAYRTFKAAILNDYFKDKNYILKALTSDHMFTDSGVRLLMECRVSQIDAPDALDIYDSADYVYLYR